MSDMQYVMLFLVIDSIYVSDSFFTTEMLLEQILWSYVIVLRLF